MVDRISKVSPDHLRVDGTKDSTEEEGQGAFAQEEEGGDGLSDPLDDPKKFKKFHQQKGVDPKTFAPSAEHLKNRFQEHDHLDESTTGHQAETTLSRTLKVLRLGWLHRLGLKDPETNRNNFEIILAYLTAIVVLSALLFSLWLILT